MIHTINKKHSVNGGTYLGIGEHIMSHIVIRTHTWNKDTCFGSNDINMGSWTRTWEQGGILGT